MVEIKIKDFTESERVALASDFIGDALYKESKIDPSFNHPEVVINACGLDPKNYVKFDITDNSIDESEISGDVKIGTPYMFSNTMMPDTIPVIGGCNRRISLQRITKTLDSADQRLGLFLYKRDRTRTKRCRSEKKFGKKEYYLLGIYQLKGLSRKVVLLYQKKR